MFGDASSLDLSRLDVHASDFEERSEDWLSTPARGDDDESGEDRRELGCRDLPGRKPPLGGSAQPRRAEPAEPERDRVTTMPSRNTVPNPSHSPAGRLLVDPTGTLTQATGSDDPEEGMHHVAGARTQRLPRPLG